MNIGILGIGSYIPSIITKNEAFLDQEFLGTDGRGFEHDNATIIEKFKAITGIEERRYADPQLKTSDMGYLAAEKAIRDAGIDKEELDYIIFAQNFGDMSPGKTQGDTLPSLATRVKHLLQIKNPKCVAYDLIFGCPGWIEGVIQATAFIKSGMARHCLVIGGETLSRVIDPHDRDSMIFSDGAGAAVLGPGRDSQGILSHSSLTFAGEEAYYLYFDKTNHSDGCPDTRYIKMLGRKIYEFACIHVPKAMAACLKESGLGIDQIDKIFIHQANEKMDQAIVQRFYRMHDREVPENVMPMSIHKLGNSSVATIPTLYDMVLQGELPGHRVDKGDVLLFASVGAGMNINAFVYRY